MEKYGSIWPLPGGVDHYFETALELLGFVRANQPTEEGLTAELKRRYKTTGKASMKAYIRILRNLGWIELQGDRFLSTSRGIDLLISRDSNRAFGDLVSTYTGVQEILDLVHAGTTDLEALIKAMNRKLGTDWTSANQVFFRLNWLRSLGLLEKNEAGKFCLSAKAHNKSLAPQGIPKAVGVPIASAPVPDPTALGGLIESLESTAIKGESGVAFEKAVANAFSFLGFEVLHIGGSGDTDLVATGRNGRSPIKIVVDAKSRSNGPVSDGDINWAAIEDHSKKHKALASIIVGKSFSEGRVQAHAERQRVGLLSVADLVRLLKEHERTPLGVGALTRCITSRGGVLTDTEWSALLGEVAERVDLAEVVAQVFGKIWSKQASAGAIDANVIYWLLQEQVDHDRIKDALTFLQSEVVAAVAEDEGLRTLCSPITLASRLERLADLLRRLSSS